MADRQWVVNGVLIHETTTRQWVVNGVQVAETTEEAPPAVVRKQTILGGGILA